MQLIGANNTTFALAILGYEFPRNHYAPYDADWLNVRIEASDHRGRWSATAHCLLTWEVAQLADWLGALATTFEESQRIGFMEPNLRFITTSEARALRVYFDKAYARRAPQDSAVSCTDILVAGAANDGSEGQNWHHRCRNLGQKSCACPHHTCSL